MKIKFALDDGAFEPTKAHDVDAGFDLRIPTTQKVLRVGGNQSLIVDTGVHLNIPPNYVGMVKSKSGLFTKYGLFVTGVVDSGYDGSIVICIVNTTLNSYMFEKGDKIAQIVIMPIPIVEMQLVDSIDRFEVFSSRGSNGFGSSGR